MSETRVLTASMDNLDASRLGKIVADAARRTDYGDQIDRGLILLKMLNDAGYKVTVEVNPRVNHSQ